MRNRHSTRVRLPLALTALAAFLVFAALGDFRGSIRGQIVRN